jgi:hypothetical protein
LDFFKRLDAPSKNCEADFLRVDDADERDHSRIQLLF